MASNTVPHSEIPPAQDTANFLERATPYIRFGIPVFPLQPREKKPIAGFARWPDLASTDPKQIAAWNTENPTANCGLVAKDDGFLILEFDVASGMRDAAAEMGQKIPITRAHRSGGGYGHWIFKQTDRSRAVGNRSVNRPDPCRDPACKKAEPGKTHYHEWFSFRQHNKYVVGPGSIHPNGTEYTVAREMTPVACPDWICDWVEKHTISNRPASGERVAVCDDFDFDALMEWYDIEIVNVDGDYHNPRYCPVKGDSHTKLTDCAFYYDGETLGWKDFAQECDGSHMSIGDLLRHLNQEHAPYPERIWPGEGTDWLEDDDELELVDVESVEPSKPVCDFCNRTKDGGCQCKTMVDDRTAKDFPDPAKYAAPLVSHVAETDEEAAAETQPPAIPPTRRSFEETLAMLTPAAFRQSIIDGVGLRPMPESALYGWLGERARLLGLPLGLAYPAILTCYSALPTLPDILGNHYGLFTVAVMGVGGGKNVTLNRSVKVLEMRNGSDYMDATLGGVGGLWQLLGEKTESGGKGKEKVTTPGPARMLINPSEFGATMINMKIKNSTLATHLCNLWDKQQIVLPVREGNRPINCRLSILGALPANKDAPETFTRYFSVETGEGLYSRFLFAFSEEKLDLRWAEEWKPSIPFSKDMCDDIVPMGDLKGWTAEARAYYSDLVLPYDVDGRGLQNLKRVALLTSLANRDEFVTLDAVICAEVFMLWQAQLKKTFTAGVAEQVNHGELSTIIMDTLTRIDEQGHYDQCVVIDGALQISISRVIHQCGWKRYGIGEVERTIKALIQTGQLKVGRKYKAGNLPGGQKVSEPSAKHIMVTKF